MKSVEDGHTGALVTETLFLGGALRLKQMSGGHRAGSDAVILAATVPASEAGLVVDAGSGTGAAGLAVAIRAPGTHVRLVEIDRATARLARETVGINRLEGRVTVVEADLLAAFGVRKAGGQAAADADHVITNPPYLSEGQARLSPDPDRRRAHVMPEGGLDRWVLACQAMLKARGVLTMIHRADALAGVLAALSGHFGGLVVKPVHPRADAAATRILVSGQKGSRAPLRILPGLVLHEADGRFTDVAEALHRGVGTIDLQP